MNIWLLLVLVAAAGGVYWFYRRKHGYPVPPSVEPSVPDPVPAPTSPPMPDPGLGPDAQGRVRIPAIEALGGDWQHCWWYTPQTLIDHPDLDPVVVWQIRWACVCDEHGLPGAGYVHRGYGFVSPYSWMVPRKYELGTDKYGRPNMIFQSEDARGEPIRIKDKLTRATRIADVDTLVAYLRDNRVQAIPKPAPGDWIGEH